MLDKIEIRSIIEQLKEELLPIGSILIYPSEKIPSSFLPCDGRELSKKAYPELYTLMKGTWEETKYSFFLPDLRGQFVRGWDDGDGADPDSGADSVRKIGSKQTDAFQGHGHETEQIKGSTSSDGSHTHNVYREKHGGGMGTIFYSLNHENNCFSDSCKIGTANIRSSGYHNHSFEINVNVTSPKNNTYGPVRYATETRPKNIALMFCIKVK